jgi:hypothetical protein
MYQAENVLLLRTLYEWSIVSAQDIHSPKYAISKKFSEVSQSDPVSPSVEIHRNVNDTRHLAAS